MPNVRHVPGPQSQTSARLHNECRLHSNRTPPTAKILNSARSFSASRTATPSTFSACECKRKKFPKLLQCKNKIWCCRRGLNSRPLPYQGSALPLSYGSLRLRHVRLAGPQGGAGVRIRSQTVQRADTATSRFARQAPSPPTPVSASSCLTLEVLGSSMPYRMMGWPLSRWERAVWPALINR